MLISCEDGPQVCYRGLCLYDRNSPKTHATQKLLSVPLLPNTLYLIWSPLLFYGCKELESRLHRTSECLAVEPDPELYSLSLSHNSTGIPFYHTPTLDALAMLVQGILNRSRYRRIQIIDPGRGHLFSKDLRKTFQSLQQELVEQAWRNRATRLFLSDRWIRNIFSNVHLLPESLPLSALKTSKPVMVVGAGISIERSLPWIIKHRSALFVICVDTALRTLLDLGGIHPDLVLVLESQVVNAKDFIGIQASVNILADLTAYPGLLRKLPGKKCLMTSVFADLVFFSGSFSPLLPNQQPPRGSVGISAVQVALSLTKATVYLSGLDFYYAPDKPHTRGAYTHLIALSESNRFSPFRWFDASMKRLKPLEDNGTDQARDPILSGFAKTLNSLSNPRLRQLEKNPLLPDLLVHPLTEAPGPAAEPLQAEVTTTQLTQKTVLDLVMMERDKVQRLLQTISATELDESETILQDLGDLDYLLPELALILGERMQAKRASLLHSRAIQALIHLERTLTTLIR